MTKPKNMTPDQELAWKEAQRQRRTRPDQIAKTKQRQKDWYENKGGREKVIAKTKASRETNEGRVKRNEADRIRLASNVALREAAKKRQDEWRASEAGGEKSRLKARKYYEKTSDEIKNRRKDSRRFDAFMRQMEREAAENEVASC